MCDNAKIEARSFPCEMFFLNESSSNKSKAIKSYLSILDHAASGCEDKKNYKFSLSCGDGIYIVDTYNDANPMIIIDDLDEYMNDPVCKMLGCW